MEGRAAEAEAEAETGVGAGTTTPAAKEREDFSTTIPNPCEDCECANALLTAEPPEPAARPAPAPPFTASKLTKLSLQRTDFFLVLIGETLRAGAGAGAGAGAWVEPEVLCC